jgi:glycosyltransferase involved in cell wall biosynthesis
VSVIVPVYNAGPYLDECVGSILAQTLGPQAVEGVLVDDGSTDDSPARLDALAADHPNLTVIHQANSGWPGKPRNVGIDAARGDFVFFLDNDDTLDPTAMERLVATADRTGADVVLGRMAGFHRAVARDLFYEDRDRVSIDDAPLMEALTPHKLFRRAFVEANGLRFPEGRRRLEDHPFVIRAYFLASNIAIVASTVCYYHIRRDDHSNAGLRRFDPVGYYANLREGLDLIEGFTEPGPRRDRILTRYARSELLGRLRERTFVEHPDDYRAVLYREIKAVIDGRIPVSVDALLAPVHRVQMALVRADRPDLVLAFAHDLLDVTAAARLETVRARAGTLELGVAVALGAPDAPVGIEDVGDGPALGVAPAIAAVVDPTVRRLGTSAGGGSRIVLRRRDDWAEVVGPRQPVAIATDGRMLAGSVATSLDLASVSAGAPIWPGTWDALVRVDAFGISRDIRLGADRAPGIADRFAEVKAVARPSLGALPYWTDPGDNLSVRIAARRPRHRRWLSELRRRLPG